MSQVLKSNNLVESIVCEDQEVVCARSMKLVGAIKEYQQQRRDAYQQSESFPKIPEVKFVVSKGDEREEFSSWSELDDWALEMFYEDFRTCYLDDQRDGARHTDINEWLDCADKSLTEDIIGENEWKLERVKV